MIFPKISYFLGVPIMLKTYETYAKTTVKYLENVTNSKDKYGVALVRKYDKYNWWIKVISYHKKASKLKSYLAFPTTLESPKLQVLEWFTKTAIVKEENTNRPNQFTFFMLTQVSYLMENHHKYIDEYRTPITEGEYMQMNAIYKTKEAKQVRYTFLDLTTSTTYKVVEFGNGEARVTPELPPEQQLTIPDWLDEILPKQTEEEWLEIWKQGMESRRKERYQYRKEMKKKYGWPKYKRKRKLSSLSYVIKARDLKQQLYRANKKIEKLEEKHTKQKAAIVKEINAVAKKVIDGKLTTTAKTANTLNKITKRINGQTVDTTSPNSKAKLAKTYTPTRPTKQQILEEQQAEPNNDLLPASQQTDTPAVGTQQPNPQPQPEESMWDAYWKKRKR